MENKVKVKSLVKGRLGIFLPDLKLNLRWDRKGQTRTIDFETLQEALFDPGTEYMFKEGMLGIEDMEQKIALDLEPEGATEPQFIKTLDDATMKRMMTVMPIFDFKQELKTVPREQILNLVDYAIENEYSDINKCDVLKEITGIDIISAIRLNREDKEPVKGE
jgi:hypothetical protein